MVVGVGGNSCFSENTVFVLCMAFMVILFVFQRLLKVDNNGQEQIAESAEMVNEGYRVDLSSDPSSYSKAQTYTTTQGHTVSTPLNFCGG